MNKEQIDRRLAELHPVRREIVTKFLDLHHAWDTDFVIVGGDSGTLRWNYESYPYAEMDMQNAYDEEDEEPEEEYRGRLIYRYQERPVEERGYSFQLVLQDRDPLYSFDFHYLLRRFSIGERIFHAAVRGETVFEGGRYKLDDMRISYSSEMHYGEMTILDLDREGSFSNIIHLEKHSNGRFMVGGLSDGFPYNHPYRGKYG